MKKVLGIVFLLVLSGCVPSQNIKHSIPDSVDPPVTIKPLSGVIVIKPLQYKTVSVDKGETYYEVSGGSKKALEKISSTGTKLGNVPFGDRFRTSIEIDNIKVSSNGGEPVPWDKVLSASMVHGANLEELEIGEFEISNLTEKEKSEYSDVAGMLEDGFRTVLGKGIGLYGKEISQGSDILSIDSDAFIPVGDGSTKIHMKSIVIGKTEYFGVDCLVTQDSISASAKGYYLKGGGYSILSIRDGAYLRFEYVTSGYQVVNDVMVNTREYKYNKATSYVIDD